VVLLLVLYGDVEGGPLVFGRGGCMGVPGGGPLMGGGVATGYGCW
jgi:hypothetical protein